MNTACGLVNPADIGRVIQTTSRLLGEQDRERRKASPPKSNHGHQLIDLSGKSFGEWTVLHRSETLRYGQPTWWCKCSCGLEKSVYGADLRHGRSTKCRGCSNKAKKKNKQLKAAA